MKARKLPSGSWCARAFSHVADDGKKVYKSFTADTKAEAEFLANKFKFDKKESVKSDLTVGEAMDKYIENRESIFSPTTVRAYKQQRNCYFKFIINVNITKLTNQQVQKAVNLESKNHSPKTVRNAYGLLTASLSENGISISATLPKPVKSEMVIPTNENIRLLLKSVQGTYLEVVFLLAANTGMRRSEICALTWGDIKGDTITINKAKVKNEKNEWVIKKPKSYAGTRVVPVPHVVIDRMYTILGKNNEAQSEIFPMPPYTISNSFAYLRKKYNMNFRFHDFRHYNASVMLALGIPDKYAMERLGQSTPSVLKNVYQHLLDDKKSEVTDLLNSKLAADICNEICNESVKG